ncbi:uncharacterized protein LOC131066370 [Cryptomeria japonica]|uniref:uncharacterized protein LOC131066370 n=1 Tax=Cryptomeria japonica TaxID=3369 RepID=UPI0027DA8328|nr:uncharacterized protein LOC131066370 [Cryptomeria japonica]
MRINMQAKPHSPRAEHYPSRRVEYDENAAPVGIPGIDHETKEEMDSVGKPTAIDKIALATDVINDKVDFDATSELAPNITNMSICEVDSPTCNKASTNDQSALSFNPENGQKVPSLIYPTQECSPRISHQLSIEEMRTPNGSTPTASRSGIFACLAEDGEFGLRDISIDEGVPSEDKVLISLDRNIYFEKPSRAMSSATIESSCCGIGLRNKQCKPEDQSSSGDDWDRLNQGELQCSQLNKRNEDENGMLDEAGILNSLKVDEIFPTSFKEIHEGNQNEGTHSFDECRSGNTTLEKKENILGCLAKYGDRYDEQWYNLVDYSDGIHDKGITSNANCIDDSFKAEGKENKDMSYSSQGNAEQYLSNNFRTRTNPFADSEENSQFMSESASASVGRHSALSGIFEAEGKITDRGYLSHEDAELFLSNNFHMRTNPFALSEEEAQFMPESFASVENHSVSTAQFIPGLYSTSLESHTAPSADKSSESEGKNSKDTDHSSQVNSEVCLSEKFQLRTNPFAISEEEAQFMPASFESLESHSVSSASLLTGHVVSEHLSDVSSSKSEGSVLKASDNFQIDPAIVQKVISEKLGSEVDPQKSVEEPHLEKCGNSTDPYTAENFVQIHTSTAAMVDNEATRNMENLGQKIVGCSAFTGSPAGQVCSLEMGYNVPRQSISEVRYDVSDKVNVNDNASEMSAYTHSGPISISGPISHSGQIPLSGRVSYSSGPIPYSGSLSTRSDSSTASTHSFAFPILPNEWNSSPVKMKQADSRYFKKKRRCRFCCFCF